MNAPLRLLQVAGSGPSGRWLRSMFEGLAPGSFRLRPKASLTGTEAPVSRGEVDLLLVHQAAAVGPQLPGPRDLLTRMAELAPVILIVSPEQEEWALGTLELGVQDYLLVGRTTQPELIRMCRATVARFRHQAALRNLATTDDLTGLHNRRGFLTLAGHHLSLARRAGRGLLLLYADVDNLKEINDRFGHGVGDLALVQAARVLQETFRRSDILGRLGGDEFAALLLEPVRDAGSILLERLDRKLQEARSWTDLPFSLALSRGLALFDPARPSSLEELLGKADRRMYQDRRKASPGREAEA